MGMYDYVKFSMECPRCKSIMNDFQSKDRDCLMRLYNWWEVNNFYTHCCSCRTWVEFTLKLRNRPNRKLTIKDYKKTIRKTTKKDDEKHEKKMKDLFGNKREKTK